MLPYYHTLKSCVSLIGGFISQAPRIMNEDDLPDAPDDAIPNSYLTYMCSDLSSMMKEIRGQLTEGERIIEKK